MLTQKYGAQFSDEPTFTHEVNVAFQFKASKDAHVLNFGHVHWDQFLEEPTPSVRASDAGFFAASGNAARTINPAEPAQPITP